MKIYCPRRVHECNLHVLLKGPQKPPLAAADRMEVEVHVQGVKEGKRNVFPKELNSTAITQFMSISLLSVDGKIFFSVTANRATTYVTAYKYVDRVVQKGVVPGISRYTERATMIWQAIQKVETEKRNRQVVWIVWASA